MSLERNAATERANVQRQSFVAPERSPYYRPAPSIDELRARWAARRAAQ